MSSFDDPRSPYDGLGDSLLERLIVAGHDATEKHANDYLAWVEADIRWDQAHDKFYNDSRATTHAAKEREADMLARDESNAKKRAKGAMEVADKRARFALAALSAMQTQARLEGGQT